MKFGSVPVAQAKDGVLAHSIATPKGRLRKGRVLSADDIADLKAAGLDAVVIARLGSSDVDENTAAAALADALVVRNDTLKTTKAFTGRVNLIAEGAGLAVLDIAAIEAVNAVDPMITVATVPPFQQMAKGGMVATIKMISYAVDQADLDRACNAAHGAIAMAVPALKTATLLITEIPGGAGDKGRKAIQARLDAFGVALIETAILPHEESALAAGIAAAQGEVVLILTGSATSDIDDTAPAALRAAGGRITRFGMPVDPGNLLFLGDLRGRPVIGLPGCARAPALNGADWVLGRVLCGIPVTSADIAGMGVGGLLKEIPTRPQPRRG